LQPRCAAEAAPLQAANAHASGTPPMFNPPGIDPTDVNGAHARNRQVFSIFLLPLLVIAGDQAMKWWILNVVQLQLLGKIEISAIFDLTFVKNYGVSFGQLRADSPLERWGLVALSGVIATVFAIWLVRSDRGLTRLALALVIGGAVGNMIDRVRFGYVVDFFDFSGMHFPWIFNVADVAINVGAGLLILDMFLEPKARPTPQAAPDPTLDPVAASAKDKPAD
jgi:signal peptidase II